MGRRSELKPLCVSIVVVLLQTAFVSNFMLVFKAEKGVGDR